MVAYTDDAPIHTRYSQNDESGQLSTCKCQRLSAIQAIYQTGTKITTLIAIIVLDRK